MWFALVKKLILPFSSYTVKTFLARQLKCCASAHLLVPNNNFAYPSENFKFIFLRTLTTKSKLVENVIEESKFTRSPEKKRSTRKKSIPKEVLQYFISNEMEAYIERIPKVLLNVKRKAPEIRYIFNESVAGLIVDAIKDDLLQNESPILETNPGLGSITKRLLELPLPRIHLYEPSHDFKLHLNDLVQSNPDRLSLTDYNFFTVAKLVFQDKLDNGTRLKELLHDLPTREWTAPEPALRIIGVLPSLHFVKHLMLSLIFQCGLMVYGRPELYVVMDPLLYTHLTCDGTAGYSLYRTSSVLFQLIFHTEILTKFPREAVFPWLTGFPDNRLSKLRKLQGSNTEWVYLVKMTARSDFYDSVVPSEQLQQLWFFIQNNMTSRNNRIIPQLERWIPGCGPRVITRGLNIFSRFGDLCPQQILSLFKDFSSWPEYSVSPFLASVEYAYLKMEPGSDDLDDAPTQKKDVAVVEDDIGLEIGSEADPKPSL